jgi:hypothetical protein
MARHTASVHFFCLGLGFDLGFWVLLYSVTDTVPSSRQVPYARGLCSFPMLLLFFLVANKYSE